MDADKRRWVVALIISFILSNGMNSPEAIAFVDLDWVAAKETEKLQKKYDRIIRWRSAYSEKHFGYSFPRVDASEIKSEGVIFVR